MQFSILENEKCNSKLFRKRSLEDASFSLNHDGREVRTVCAYDVRWVCEESSNSIGLFASLAGLFLATRAKNCWCAVMKPLLQRTGETFSPLSGNSPPIQSLIVVRNLISLLFKKTSCGIQTYWSRQFFFSPLPTVQSVQQHEVVRADDYSQSRSNNQPNLISFALLLLIHNKHHVLR